MLADLPVIIISALAVAWPMYALAGLQQTGRALGLYTYVQVALHVVTSQVRP